jgi:hypothetical protein
MKFRLLGIYAAKCTCQRINILEDFSTLMVWYNKLECFNWKLSLVFLTLNEYVSRTWIYIKQKENLTSNFCSFCIQKEFFRNK